MFRHSTRKCAKSSLTVSRLAISISAAVLLWGLFGGAARGQDLLPAPPDFKRAECDGSPVHLSSPPPAEAISTGLLDFTGVTGRLERARARIEERRYRQALEDVEYVVRRDSDNLGALKLRALCRMMLGLPLDDAFLEVELTAVDQSLEHNPADASVRALRGALLTCKGNFDRAIAELSYAIERRAGQVATYYYRGIARFGKRNYKQALEDLNLAAGLCDPHRIPAQILTARGNCHAACDDFDRAIADFSSVVEQYPKDYRPYHLRAEAYFQKKDTVHCLADHDQIVKLRPDDFMVYLVRSFVRYQHGDQTAARADMDRAVQLKPEAPVTYFCRAVLSILMRQDCARALTDMDRAIALEPGFPCFYLFRGYVLARTLKYGPAVRDFAFGLCTLAQMEFTPTFEIDNERGRFKVGFVLKRKDDPADPRAELDAARREDGVILVAMRHLLGATVGQAD